MRHRLHAPCILALLQKQWLQAPPAFALQVKTTTSQHLGDDFDTLFAGLAPAKGSPISGEEMRRCLFGDYMNTAAEPDERQYAEASDAQALISTMEGYLVDYNGGRLHWTWHAAQRILYLSTLASCFMVLMLARSAVLAQLYMTQTVVLCNHTAVAG